MIGSFLLLGLASAQSIGIDVDYAVPGEATHITVDGAMPGESVKFIRSFQGLGNGPCPAALGGLCIDLRSPTLLGSGTANAQGVASYTMNVPATAPLGGTISFQAVIGRGQGGANSVKSEVVATDVAPSFQFTATVDGDASEYPAGSWFDATSGSWAVSYDADYLYIAAAHPDVGASSDHWVVIYFGDASSTATAGIQLNSQTPGLTVPASAALRWKADGSYDSFLAYDEAIQSWVDSPSWLANNGAVAFDTQADVVEFAIPLSAVGPKSFTLQASWVYEGSGFESTYAGLPYGTVIDGYDPDFSEALSLDRRSSFAPAEQ